MLQGTRQKPKTSLIEDFANWPSESLGRFTKDYGPLRDAFSGGDEFEFTCDEWKQAQIDFRRQWETRMLQGQGRRVARIDPYHRLPTLGSEQLVFGWDDELRYEAATIERVLMMELCSQRRGRLRKCGRAGCPNPYFLSNRPLRKYCSDLCANYAQRESKKKWWHNEGAEQRRKKAAKVKKRKSRK
ncbi:MAG: hypothetical protein O2968_19960 [Acidobacteria bacterium]|nr:hypothetical protein [Acidobacteriota bacterium]